MTQNPLSSKDDKQIDELLDSLIPDTEVIAKDKTSKSKEMAKLMTAILNSRKKQAKEVILDIIVRSNAQAALEARISELNSLDHNKQMFGDWQQVIADRLVELQAQQKETHDE